MISSCRVESAGTPHTRKYSETPLACGSFTRAPRSMPLTRTHFPEAPPEAVPKCVKVAPSHFHVRNTTFSIPDNSDNLRGDKSVRLTWRRQFEVFARMLVTTASAVAIAGTDASRLSGRVLFRSPIGGLNRQFLRGQVGDIGEQIRMAVIAKTATESTAYYGLPVCTGPALRRTRLVSHSPP